MHITRHIWLRLLCKSLHPYFVPLRYGKHQISRNVEVILLNEHRPNEWEKISEYLNKNIFIDNKTAREITDVVQTHEMSRMFSKWVKQGLLEIFNPDNKAPKHTKYKLANKDDI